MVLIGALFYGEQAIEKRGRNLQRNDDQLVIDAQQMQAAAKLQAEIQRRLEAQTALSNLISQTENDREIQQLKNRADLRARQSGPRLQFTAQAARCGASGDTAASAAAGSASDPSSTTVQLPEPLNGDLLQFAADAQSLAIDYGVLYTFVHNPKLVCELRP